MTVSTEDLHLQVIGQIAKRAKQDLTLQDSYDDLRSQNQHQAIKDLIAEQNERLQRVDPRFEWKVAGIQRRTRHVHHSFTETIHIIVILKTELILATGSREQGSSRIFQEIDENALSGLVGRRVHHSPYSHGNNVGGQRSSKPSRSWRRRSHGEGPSRRSDSLPTGAPLPHSTFQQRNASHTRQAAGRIFGSSQPVNEPHRIQPVFVRRPSRPFHTWVEFRGDHNSKSLRMANGELRARRPIVSNSQRNVEEEEEEEEAIISGELIDELVSKWNDAISLK